MIETILNGGLLSVEFTDGQKQEFSGIDVVESDADILMLYRAKKLCGAVKFFKAWYLTDRIIGGNQ